MGALDQSQVIIISRAKQFALVVVGTLLYAASAAPLLPTLTPQQESSSRGGSAAKLTGCPGALSRKTVVIYPGPVAPYLGSLPNFMPNHGIDVDPEDTSLLALSDPEQAACARGIKDITDTLVIWEDGTLPNYRDALPKGIVSTAGTLVLYGKPGRVGKGIENLNFLNSLKSVKGLSVYDLDGLQDLKGLDSLQTVSGDLLVSENMMLRSLEGLDQLQSIGGDLIMNSNMNLVSVAGLQNLETIGGQFLLKGNGRLRTLDAMTSLRTVGQSTTLINNGNHNMKLPRGAAVGSEDAAFAAAGRAREGPGGNDDSVLIIHGDSGPPSVEDVFNTAFTYMPPLQNFDITPLNARFAPSGQAVNANPGGVIRGHVVIWDDGTLGSLGSTLYHVKKVTGSFVYLGGVAINSDLNQTGLQNFWGLDSLKSVGALGIVGGSKILNLEGFKALEDIDGSLTVAFCPRIKSLKGLGPEGTEVIAFSSVPSPSVLSEFMNARSLGRKVLQGHNGGLRKVASEVWIAGNPELKDLTGLEGLEEIGWRMTIDNNLKLESLAALGSLKSIGGGLVVKDNPSLTSTAGLASLEDVGLHAHFHWNIGLQDIEGLSRIKEVKGDVAIVASPMIKDLSPLSRLTAVGMNFIISRIGIEDLNGVGNLVFVGGLVDVSDNWYLTSLNGLDSLTTIGDALYLINNPRLFSLGLMASTLELVNGGVYVEDTPNLKLPSGWTASLRGSLPLPAPAPPPVVSENTLANSARAVREHASSTAIANPVAPRDAAYGAAPGSLGGAYNL